MGYPTDIFLNEPADSCICAICHDVLKEASSLSCGHSFCTECIDSLIINLEFPAIDPSCPTCRVTGSSNPNYAVRGIIDALEVSCPHGGGECGWLGKVGELQSHGKECSYKVIECGIEGCTHTCQRKDMAAHRSSNEALLQHMELKYERKMSEMEDKLRRRLSEMEEAYDNKDDERKAEIQSCKNKLRSYKNKVNTLEEKVEVLERLTGVKNKKRKNRSADAMDISSVRPAVPSSVWKTSENDLNFKWIDIELISGSALAENPHAGKRVFGATKGIVPILRLYGVNETGNSVAVFIHGFTPYAYFALPHGYDIEDSNDNLGQVRQILEDKLRAELGMSNHNHASEEDEYPKACLGVQHISGNPTMSDTSHTIFLQIYVAMPRMLTKLKEIMESGITFPGVTNANITTRELLIFPSFECNMPLTMRFMHDQDLEGSSSLCLPKGTYSLRKGRDEKETHYQV